MRLIKISPKFQITIPSYMREFCHSGWFAIEAKKGLITLRPVEIQEAKTEEEIMKELIGDMKMPWEK